MCRNPTDVLIHVLIRWRLAVCPLHACFLFVLLTCAACDVRNPRMLHEADLPQDPRSAADINSYFGVSNGGDANSILREWVRPGIDEGVGRERCKISEFLKVGIAVDCSGPLRNEVLKSLESEKRSIWLRLRGSAPADIIALAGKLRTIHGLSLREIALRETDMSPLAGLANLQWLDLSSTDLSSQDLRAFSSCENLETVFLCGSHFGDDSLAFLNGLPKLRALWLSYSSVTDEGIRQIAEDCPQLESLSVFAARSVSPFSCNTICEMKHLQYLVVGGSGLSPDYSRTHSVQALQVRLPDCHIDFGS